MQAPYSLELQGTDNGSKVIIVVKNNSEEKELSIVVTIHGYHNKTDNGFSASAEFFEGDNRIEDLKRIIKNKSFWELIEYYHKEIIDLPSKEEEEGGGGGVLNDDKFAQEPKRTVKGTNFLGEVARSIASKSRSKTNITLDPNFLIALGSIRQGFSVYTTFKNYNHEEIIIARTHTAMAAYASKYTNLTLFNRKLTTVLFHLHLANVIFANRLILKQASDIITGIEKVVSYIRRRALPYSFLIATVNGIAAAAYYTGTASETSIFQVYSDADQLGTLFYLVILPLIWPIAAFFMRMYAPKIFPIIVRHAIKRILKS